MKIRVRIAQQDFTVDVGDLNARPIQASVDGELFEVWPEEPAALPAALAHPAALPALPLSLPAQRPAPAGGRAGVSAPIPGTVVSVAVHPGDVVTPGQELLVLEAMKMKNLIRATHAAKISSVTVQPGERVTQGQRLIEFGEE